MMRTLGLTCAVAVALGASGTAAQEITVVSFGGSYQEGQSKALFQPAAKAMNIKLKEETYTGIADLRLKVKAGAVTWEVPRRDQPAELSGRVHQVHHLRPDQQEGL
jgi:putative spermidine/putrescine transport system substrate-binding protein